MRVDQLFIQIFKKSFMMYGDGVAFCFKLHDFEKNGEFVVKTGGFGIFELGVAR